MGNQTNRNVERDVAFENFYATENERQDEIIQHHIFHLLHLAFTAGWEAGKKHKGETKP